MSERVFDGDFRAGSFATDPGATWQVRPVGGQAEGDGLARTTPDGLVVVPRGTNPSTGRPCFVGDPDEVGHLRWAALANRVSSNGFPGFDVGPEAQLVVEAELSVEAYGLERHPYGRSVADPRRDLRLGAAGLITLDRESSLVFDFMVTDGCVYAVYERLPGAGATPAAAFSYAVPVADRRAGQAHRCAIVYSRGDGSVRWLLEGIEVLAVDRLGHRALDPAFATRDDGGPEDAATPRQLTVGLGLFAERPWGQGVRLVVGEVTVSHRAGRKEQA